MSRAPDGRVLLCRLYERQSTSERRYLIGLLGTVKIVALLNAEAEPKFGATACFNVFIEASEDRASDAAAATTPRPHNDWNDVAKARTAGRAA